MELNTVLSMVRKLIERSEHPATDPKEATACRLKADAMMLKHAIDEAAVNASRPADERVKPGKLPVTTICEPGNPARHWLFLLVSRICVHCRCEPVFWGVNRTDRPLQVVVYGFESDLKFFEILFTVVYLHLGSHLSPKWDDSRDETWNIAELHKRGLNWLDIARINPAQPGGLWDGNQYTAQRVGSRVKRIYRQWCEANGQPYVATGNRIQYIKNFAEYYTYEINRRLDEMARNRQPGKELLLASAMEEVVALRDADHPDIKDARVNLSTRYNPDAARAGQMAGREADLSGGRGGVANPNRHAIE